MQDLGCHRSPACINHEWVVVFQEQLMNTHSKQMLTRCNRQQTNHCGGCYQWPSQFCIGGVDAKEVITITECVHVCVSHHGTDGLLPVRSLSGMDVSQFRHNVFLLQMTSRPQAPAAHKYANLLFQSGRVMWSLWLVCWLIHFHFNKLTLQCLKCHVEIVFSKTEQTPRIDLLQ